MASQVDVKKYLVDFIRKWCIIKGSEIEKEDPTIEKLIVKQELMLCDQMLAKDERNFHVWNYRSWIVNTFKSENHALVDNELKFINSKLEHNFSNFSALHFKSKNLLSKYALYLDEHKDEKMEESQELEKIKDILIHRMPFETLKEEFEKVKTGLYMQSGEQSMWLYHKWLLDVISPIKVFLFRYI
jgi:Protein prenyltransferase, alpha subunit